MSPLQFLILAQIIIFLLGWPLEWTEIIVIFMPIFIPLLPHFHIDPLFFSLLVALNLQTAFLLPPLAMAAFYLKGCRAAACDAEPDLRRHDAVHGDSGHRADPALRVPRHRIVVAAGAVQINVECPVGQRYVRASNIRASHHTAMMSSRGILRAAPRWE